MQPWYFSFPGSPPCTLHLARPNAPDNSPKCPWLLVWPELEAGGGGQQPTIKDVALGRHAGRNL